MEKKIQILYGLYARLAKHLAAHSDTDEWATPADIKLEEEKQENEETTKRKRQVAS